jgi:cell division initiation protein
MKITPRDIHNQEFKRSLRGYDMDEVDSFLQQIADELETLLSDNAQLKDQVKELKLRMEEYKSKDELLEKTLLAAQQATEQMKEASRKEVDAASKAAKAEAAKIIEDARAELTETSQRIRDLKRYRYDLIIQYKALLDRHYHLLAEMAGEVKAEREREMVISTERGLGVGAPGASLVSETPEASKTGSALPSEEESPAREASGPGDGGLITVEVENLDTGVKAGGVSAGRPKVEVIGEPDGSFDAERAADEVFRRLGGEDEGEPIG